MPYNDILKKRNKEICTSKQQDACFYSQIPLWKWKWRDIRPSMVTHTRNLCSAFNPSKVHTHREHTPGAVGSHLCCGARGAVGGSVPCSRAPQSWYWGWRERAGHSLPPPTIPAGPETRNSQPLDYESNSLTIRPRLPLYVCMCTSLLGGYKYYYFIIQYSTRLCRYDNCLRFASFCVPLI